MNKKKSLLVCDLDNTLYDWVEYFVKSFYAMVDVVVELTGCNRDKLLDDFRSVHQHYHDSEHPFALLETESIKTLYKGCSVSEMYRALNPAFHAFNIERRKTLVAHDGVRESLSYMRSCGVKIVAHTESRVYSALDRLVRLELYEYFSKIYCRERTVTLEPDPDANRRWLEKMPFEKVIELSQHQMKPDPDVLKEICSDENVNLENSAYVGDSIARDILMAKRAGVFAIWASYGASHFDDSYEKLVRVTHWTEDDIVREKTLRKEAKQVRPDYVAKHSFREVLEALKL